MFDLVPMVKARLTKVKYHLTSKCESSSIPRMMFSTALAHFGTSSRMAKILGVSKQAVALWKKTGKVPSKSAMRLEELTGGAIKVDPKVYATESKRNGAGA